MKRKPFLTFLVFLALSTALWLLIKLSEQYDTQTTFRIRLEGVPAEKWIASPEQTVKFSMTTDGFHTLRYEMIREANRTVTLDLNDVPFRLENGNTFSFSSQYVAEHIANRIGIGASDLTMNDAKVYFNMEDLESKVVPVVLRSDLKMQRQFDVYGLPTIDPAIVTIYGPKEVIDTIKSVKTNTVERLNVSESFSQTVPLDLLDGMIHANFDAVTVGVTVEKFTEADVSVPFLSPDSLTMRFFPDAMKVKCLVAIRDYPNLAPESFRVEFNHDQLMARQPLLDVQLAAWPQFVQVLSTSPDKVEYLIVQ